MHDTLIAFGGELKATGNGKIEGYLVRFGSEKDTDLEGDFFTKDTDFGVSAKLPLYYNHGFDKEIKTRRIGSGEYKADKVGLWFEAQMELSDAYLKKLYNDGIVKSLIPSVGYSSGAVSHLVEREPVGTAWEVKAWPLGEASITPTPAEYRNRILPVKTWREMETLKSTGISEETKREILHRALMAKLKDGKSEDAYVWGWICDIYDSTLVWNGDGGCYEASYTIEGLSATIGAPKKVQRLVSYKPLPGEGKSLTIEQFTERDFERHLREAGFGQKAAAHLSHTYKALRQREADCEIDASITQRLALARLIETELLTGV